MMSYGKETLRMPNMILGRGNFLMWCRVQYVMLHSHYLMQIV